MKYNFDVYKREQIRTIWLSGNYSDKELFDKYYDAYKNYCVSKGLEYEPNIEEMYNRINRIIDESWGCELAEALYHRICNIVWYEDGRKDTEAVKALYLEFQRQIEG